MIEYDIRLPDGRSFSCAIDGERVPQSHSIKSTPWTDLKFFKCQTCPLSSETTPSCPLALDVQETLAAFKTLPEATNVDVIVKTPDRWYFKNLPIENGFNSLFSYLISTSACPILRGSPWERKFHIPFLSDQEKAFLDLAHEVVNIFGDSDTSDSSVNIPAFLQRMKDVTQTKQDFLQRCREAAKADNIVNSLFAHIEFVFNRQNDTASFAMEISQLNKKTGS